MRVEPSDRFVQIIEREEAVFGKEFKASSKRKLLRVPSLECVVFDERSLMRFDRGGLSEIDSREKPDRVIPSVDDLHSGILGMRKFETWHPFHTN